MLMCKTKSLCTPNHRLYLHHVVNIVISRGCILCRASFAQQCTLVLTVVKPDIIHACVVVLTVFYTDMIQSNLVLTVFNTDIIHVGPKLYKHFCLPKWPIDAKIAFIYHYKTYY